MSRRNRPQQSSCHFEMETTLEPIKRTLLDLDSRFFPIGIKPGDLIDLRGPEGCGKTFTLTYFMASFLIQYPTKMAILFDTSHHFNLQNLISILSHLDDSDINPADEQDETAPPVAPVESNLPKMSPKLLAFLKRLLIIECFTAQDFLANFLPNPDKSQLEQILLTNPAVSIVFIDSIDSLLCISMEEVRQSRNILQLIRNALQPTSTPLICTRTLSDTQQSQDRNYSRAGTGSVSTENRWHSDSPFSLVLDDLFITQTLAIDPLPAQPLSQIELNYLPYAEKRKKEEEAGIFRDDMKKEFNAYLRSRSRQGNGNPVPAITTHRVKFSIFSGMLWVVEDPEHGS